MLFVASDIRRKIVDVYEVGRLFLQSGLVMLQCRSIISTMQLDVFIKRIDNFYNAARLFLQCRSIILQTALLFLGRSIISTADPRTYIHIPTKVSTFQAS